MDTIPFNGWILICFLPRREGLKMEDQLCQDQRHVLRDPQHRVTTTIAMTSFQVHLRGGASEGQQASLAAAHMPERQEKLQATKDKFLNRLSLSPKVA